MPSIWRYVISLKLNDTDFEAISIKLNEKSSGKGRTEVDGPRYKKSAHIDIVSSKGMLVNNETISKETKNRESLYTGSRQRSSHILNILGDVLGIG